MITTDRLVDTFLKLVHINSPSRHEANAMRCVHAILEEMGFEIEYDDAGVGIGGNSGNLIARRSSETGSKPVFLCAHIDTVQPTENIRVIRENGLIRTDQTTILGADDKAGIACIVEAVRSLDEDGVPAGELEILITVGEEAGLLGARAFDENRVRARSGWVLDSGKPLNSIINEAPSQDQITARIIGRAAHAGSEPENGVSAITVAAHAIAAMPQGRIDFETTANVGVIEGGQATNIVAPSCTLQAEARSRSDEKLEQQTEAMTSAIRGAAERFGARAEIEVERAFTSFQVAADAREVLLAGQAMESIGMTPVLRRTGGGSDANYFNAKGMQCVILGCGYEKIHTPEEQIAEDDLVSAARLVEAVLKLASQ